MTPAERCRSWIGIETTTRMAAVLEPEFNGLLGFEKDGASDEPSLED